MDRDEAARKANEYRERLIAYVNSFMGPRMRQRFDAEDVVQSALKSFFQQEILPDTEKGLLDLLFRFTECKRKNRLRDALAGKRDLRLQQSIGEGDARHEFIPVDKRSDPVAEAIQHELDQLVDGWWKDLDAELRAVLELKQEGLSQAQIATRLGVCDRTVRRCLKEAKDNLRTLLGLEGGLAARTEEDRCE